MTAPNPEETLPTRVEPQPEVPTTTAAPSAARPFSRRLTILIGIIFILFAAAFGGFLGYNTAVRQRLDAQTHQVALQAASQFQLGLQDMQAGNLSSARQRFEYVIQLDPNFPEAREKLSQVILAAAYTATPTTPPPTPTPTVAPTEDLRPAEQLFAQAKLDLANKDWAKALETLDALRNASLTYKAIDVDGMFYVALRYRGTDQILKEGHLQEGLYNLALAERFGPLDGDARGYRTWAEMYLTGASFWKVSWQQVMYYFGQIIPYYPDLRDASGLTASERYRQAAIGYGDQLNTAKNYCEAEKQYRIALEVAPDPKVQSAADQAAADCAAANATPTPETTATPDPSQVTPTAPPGATQPTAEPPTAAPTAEAATPTP